jgi:hypothetical protein
MSVKTRVRSLRWRGVEVRDPTRKSSTSTKTSSVSPTKGKWSTPESST